jgi:hypothetical protein
MIINASLSSDSVYRFCKTMHVVTALCCCAQSAWSLVCGVSVYTSDIQQHVTHLSQTELRVDTCNALQTTAAAFLRRNALAFALQYSVPLLHYIALYI